MDWKIKTAAVLTFFSTSFGNMKAQQAENNDSIKTENPAPRPDPHKSAASFEMPAARPDSAAVQNIPDSIATITPLPQDSIVCDSLRQEMNLKKFREAEHDMLCLIAHCEGVKVRAYWDPYGKVYTIGIGNTVRPDGSPVRRFDRIKSEEELMQYFQAHVEKHIFKPMSEVINIEKASNSELVALTSFVYNCGIGCLRSYSKTEKKYVPTQFAKSLNEFFETHSEESKAAIKAYMNKKVTAKGRTLQQLVKRRDLEQRVLFGDIILNNDGLLTEENALDFSEIPLGGIYSIGCKLPTDTLDLCDRLEKIRGQNLRDSIQTQFRKQPPVIYKKRSGGR